MIVNRLPGLVLAATLGLSAVAFAQTPPPPPPPPEGGPHGMGPHGMGPHGMMAEDKGAHEAARLTALHAALNIRPDQEAAFAAFADAMKPPRPEMGMGMGPPHGDMMRDHAAMAGKSTPERLDMMARRMDEHMGRMREAFQRHSAAIKGLYAVLTPDQKHTFDALPGLMGHPGMGMGMGHGMGHPGMGHPGMGHEAEGE